MNAVLFWTAVLATVAYALFLTLAKGAIITEAQTRRSAPPHMSFVLSS